MVASPPPPPPKALSAGGDALITLFLDTDLGTHLALQIAADSTIRSIKSQVAVEHAAAFPDLGPVAVKSFEVLRNGAMYHLCESMFVRSAFAKVEAENFLHVKMAAAETATQYCRDEDRRKSSERLGELHALEDLSQEKDRKKARVTGSFDTSAVDPIRTNDSKTRDVENFDKLQLETNTNSREMLSNTSFQLEVDGNIKEDAIQLENPVLTGKNKKRKKSRLVTSKDVSALEMTEPSTGAVEVPKAIGEDLLHENQGLQGDGASMTSRDKTKVIPPDMLLSSSQLNSESQVTKHVQLGTDAQATSDLAADQGNINLVHEWYRNPIARDISISTCKVVAGGDKSSKGTNAGDHDKSAVDSSNLEKGSKSGDVLETLDNISQEKNCNQSKKVSSVGITSMDTAEAKDQCGYAEKAGRSDIISTQNEIVNDPSKRQTSNVPQGIENPNGDVKRKKKRRQHPESSKDDPTQDAVKSSEVIMNASSTENTSSRCLDANQVTLDNIGEETANEKDQCKGEKVAEPVDSTQGVSVNDPSNVQQGDSDVIKNPNGDGKRKKKKRRHLETSKDDPTQDVKKSSGLITNGSSIQNRSADPLNAEQTTPGTVGEATVSDCRKVDETVDVATTNVINEVLADLRCTDNSSKVLNEDPLTEQTKGGAALPPSAIQSDLPISSPSHKSKGKPVKIPSTVLDPSHSSVGLPDENAYTELRDSDSLRCSDKFHDLEDVLAESKVVPADSKTKSTKRQRNKVSLKHVPTDSGKAIQSLGEQVRHVPAEDLKGKNCTKAELFPEGSAVDAPSSTGQILQKKIKRSSKTRAPKIEEVDHSTHEHENELAKDNQDKYVTDTGVTHKDENTVEAPTEAPVVHKDGTTVTCDKPNARKARQKSAKTELQRQDTNLEHGSDADFVNSRVQQGADPEAVEPNDFVPVPSDNEKINFMDHFSPSAMNDPSNSAKNNDETVREVKGKKKSKRKADTHSQHAGSIEPNDLSESHAHTDKASLADHFGTGNVGVPSVSAENMNKEDNNVKKDKGKKKRKLKQDLIKPESLNPNGGNQDTNNSDVHKGRVEQGNAKESNDNAIQNDSMLQQETEDATLDRTLEKKVPQSMVGVDSLTNLPVEKDHARTSKEQRNSTSQTKPHAKSRKHDGSTDGKTSTNPNDVSNRVQSFPMSPQASNESAYGTPAVKRFRVAVRKVPRKMHEQAKGKPKKDISKRGTGAIFGDTLSESSEEDLNNMSEKVAMENSSSTSADSAWDESDVPDDDDIASLSQRSDLNSILRGSTSYKKARLKPVELLEDTEVPDSQPAT
ncbi:unnamed protein product [Alopecurus aequalis]